MSASRPTNASLTAPDSPGTTPEAEMHPVSGSTASTTVHAHASPSKRRSLALEIRGGKTGDSSGIHTTSDGEDIYDEDEAVAGNADARQEDEDEELEDEMDENVLGADSRASEMDDDSTSPKAAASPLGVATKSGGATDSRKARSNQSRAPASTRNRGGEMERRGEEKLLDERIRERYQQELGDIFDTRAQPA